MPPVTSRARSWFACALLSLVVAVPAMAGPPLLCHPFEIGAARSLPWDGSSSWFHTRADYNVANLVADTEALLASSTPVVVRMETIRRAAIYAASDRAVASMLLARLETRAQASGDPLASLDAALLTETFRQLGALSHSTALRERAAVAKAVVGARDGRALMEKAIAARPSDAAVQFAAAVMTADKDRRAYEDYAKKARAGAGSDALVARNLGHISS